MNDPKAHPLPRKFQMTNLKRQTSSKNKKTPTNKIRILIGSVRFGSLSSLFEI